MGAFYKGSGYILFFFIIKRLNLLVKVYIFGKIKEHSFILIRNRLDIKSIYAAILAMYCEKSIFDGKQWFYG